MQCSTLRYGGIKSCTRRFLIIIVLPRYYLSLLMFFFHHICSCINSNCKYFCTTWEWIVSGINHASSCISRVSRTKSSEFELLIGWLLIFPVSFYVFGLNPWCLLHSLKVKTKTRRSLLTHNLLVLKSIFPTIFPSYDQQFELISVVLLLYSTSPHDLYYT